MMEMFLSHTGSSSYVVLNVKVKLSLCF